MKSNERKELAKEAIRYWTRALCEIFEARSGNPLEAEFKESNAAAATQTASCSVLKHSFPAAQEADFWIIAPGDTASRICAAALAAQEPDRSAGFDPQRWSELLGEAAERFAASIELAGAIQSADLSGEAFSVPAQTATVFAVDLKVAGDGISKLFVAISDGLCDYWGARKTDSLALQVSPPHAVPSTLDMLLDLELRLSVSFGRTYLPVREILKLSTGSIIELNCGVNEPVDVIVNNRTIARGEVVVIDGNYGVRIHEIISRRDRMFLQHIKDSNVPQPAEIGA